MSSWKAGAQRAAIARRLERKSLPTPEQVKAAIADARKRLQAEGRLPPACPECAGAGRVGGPMHGFLRCQVCDGTGFRKDGAAVATGRTAPACLFCLGTGVIIGANEYGAALRCSCCAGEGTSGRCPDCDGTGFEKGGAA